MTDRTGHFEIAAAWPGPKPSPANRAGRKFPRRPDFDTRDPKRPKLRPIRAFILVALLAFTGCVQRTLSVTTNVPGALVYLNDREVGRTPFTVPFLWYGAYDVVVRADGYATLKTSDEVTAPFWQWPPFDLVTNFLPLQDHESMHFDLKPDTVSDPVAIMNRATELQNQMESSPHTVRKNVLDVRPTTRPTTMHTDDTP